MVRFETTSALWHLLVFGAAWLSTVGCMTRVSLHTIPSALHASFLREDRSANRHFEKGIASYDKGNLSKAKQHFREAIRNGIRPAYNNLGLVHYELGEYYAAVWAFHQAIEQMPDHVEPVYNLALTFEATERYDAALALYQQATEMMPENPLYLGNLLRVRAKLGEPTLSLIPDLQTLQQIETRADWRDWVQHLLHYEALAETLSSSNDTDSATRDERVMELPVAGPSMSAPSP